MRIKADLTLVLVALLWGSAFVAMRIAAGHNTIFFLNGWRFLLGGLLLLPFSKLKGAFNRQNILYVLLAGFALYAAVGFQQAGLTTTTAGNGGFITILYVIVVPIILWIGWRERPALKVVLAIIVAVIGGFLLSTAGTYHIASGDLLIFAGSFFWGMHVVVVGKVQGHMSALAFAVGQYFACGIFCFITGFFVETPSWQDMYYVLPAILYTAVFSITIGFTLQVIAQKHTPTNDASLILTSEAVFAALFGWIFLKETSCQSNYSAAD